MHIVVCVKQVPDWDIPPSSFKVDEGAKKVTPPPGVAPVPSQFDSIGVEAAMRLKDQQPDTKVTIVSMGPEGARDAIKHSLAMGADEGLLLTDPLFSDLDWYQAALALSTAVQKLFALNGVGAATARMYQLPASNGRQVQAARPTRLVHLVTAVTGTQTPWSRR